MLQRASAFDTCEASASESHVEIDGWSAAGALGLNPVRLEVLWFLSERDGASISEISRQVGLTRNGLQPSLRALEAIGVLESRLERLPQSCRPGRRYYVSGARLDELAWALFEALTSRAVTT
jgi:DNA-binding transcriptional ArsR family regulator